MQQISAFSIESYIFQYVKTKLVIKQVSEFCLFRPTLSSIEIVSFSTAFLRFVKRLLYAKYFLRVVQYEDVEEYQFMLNMLRRHRSLVRA